MMDKKRGGGGEKAQCNYARVRERSIDFPPCLRATPAHYAPFLCPSAPPQKNAGFLSPSSILLLLLLCISVCAISMV